MKQLRAGIMGCGKVAEYHIKAFLGREDVDFVAVCGRDLTKTQAYAQPYGVAAYDDLAQMIEESKLDVVSICTPHPLHAEQAILAADMGCHLIIEKPLATTVADCQAIVDAGIRNKVQIATVFQRRFYQPCLRIKEAIDRGAIGTPILGTVDVLAWRGEEYYNSDPWRGTWAKEGGGVMTTQATHQIDLLLWYMGEAEEVYGICKNYNHPYIEVDDTAVAIVKFKNGGIGNLVMSNSQKPSLFSRVAVHGSNGGSMGVQTDGSSVFVSGLSTVDEAPYNHIWAIPEEGPTQDELKALDGQHFSDVGIFHYHAQQIADFLDAIHQNRAPMITDMDGFRATQLLEAVYESTRTGQPVKLPFTPTGTTLKF